LNTRDLSILLEMQGPVTGGNRPDTERFRRTPFDRREHGVRDETWFVELYERRYPAVLAFGGVVKRGAPGSASTDPVAGSDRSRAGTQV
jgi:hypothetical protein